MNASGPNNLKLTLDDNAALPPPSQRRRPEWLSSLLSLIAAVILFTLAYAQAPLYTSNQNQYFLHGLAEAGYGFLAEDWLANTLDPTPVFSAFIKLSWLLVPWQPMFYLYFTALVGVFLYSVLGIINLLWDIQHSRGARWLFLAVLTILFSAGLRYGTARLLGVNWEFLFDGGVAGQRLLSTVFQPSTFGVFLVLSIYLFLARKPGWAIFALLIATTFHPTYLLSAGVLTAVYLAILFWETRKIRQSLILGCFALLGVSPILWHSLSTFFGGSVPEVTAQARKILAAYRIPHHAVISEWLDITVLIKLILVSAALLILWKGCKVASPTPQRLFHIILWPTLIALSLSIIQYLTGSVTLALLFPWRLSTWLVPLSVSLISGWGVSTWFASFQDRPPPQWIAPISVIIVFIFAGIGIVKFQISWTDKHSLDDRTMMAYVAENKQSGEVYLIPLKMQDFRLETGAPAYIEFKSIPYQDLDVIEWRRRVDFTRKVYERPRCQFLNQLATEEGVTHLILPIDNIAAGCKQAEQLYADIAYGVYRIQAK